MISLEGNTTHESKNYNKFWSKSVNFKYYVPI